MANAVFTLVAVVNALLLGAEAYEGRIAAIITAIIAALAAFTNELFTRSSVVPVVPLSDLAAAEYDRTHPAAGAP